ncbi:MAG: hypothetical protein IJX59_04135, partial [Clostridia bacterium]|nr:hypothetical protein [Clostridia bacterium]
GVGSGEGVGSSEGSGFVDGSPCSLEASPEGEGAIEALPLEEGWGSIDPETPLSGVSEVLFDGFDVHPLAAAGKSRAEIRRKMRNFFFIGILLLCCL